jgi:hypothetical protein
MSNSKKVLGWALLSLGVLIILTGFLSFANAATNFNLFGGAMSMALFFVGGIFIIIGGLLVFFMHVGKVHSHLAEQTAPGIEKTSEALGRGLKKGFKGKK